MEHVFFIEPLVAGRSGPDKDMWDIETLQGEGVATILSVNDGEMVHVSRLTSLGIEYLHIPLSSNAPIQEGDLGICLQALPRIVRFIDVSQKLGTVLIHCRSGKDRTGLALAAYLVEVKGYRIQAAMDAVKSVQPNAFSAAGWDEFARCVLSEYEQTKFTRNNAS
ncbi:dual specificity protein phosphatase family protein [Vibrio profundum]|uniref:protein-tyrosine phosphatase family protein n=1 Tax=Vibrio profundum TaxID=2910247 RepID=UPI003D13AD62